VDWTYEGHRFAWRMKLHDRETHAQFYAVDETTEQRSEIPIDVFLGKRQAQKMAARPDMILQFAHFVSTQPPGTASDPLRVEADVMVSLNGRRPQLLIDQNIDLAAQPRILRPVPWILPLTEPLPARHERPTPADTVEQSAD
jgi:hypothetical protein